MANIENLKKGIATQFSKDNQPDNAGRRPSMLKKYIKDYKVSQTDVEYIFTNLIYNHTLEVFF